tara:strand:+ start:3364 stop:3756 length:393 start_codon:yes stop_codon:yes gene_type:complete
MADATLFLNERTRQTAIVWIGDLPDGAKVEFSKPKRTVSQSDRMWAHVTDVSKSGHEHYGRKHTPQQWKLIFLGHLGTTMDVVPGLYGQGVVDLGQSSSKLNKEQMTDLITIIEAYCAENAIVLGDSVGN